MLMDKTTTKITVLSRTSALATSWLMMRPEATTTQFVQMTTNLFKTKASPTKSNKKSDAQLRNKQAKTDSVLIPTTITRATSS